MVSQLRSRASKTFVILIGLALLVFLGYLAIPEGEHDPKGFDSESKQSTSSIDAGGGVLMEDASAPFKRDVDDGVSPRLIQFSSISVEIQLPKSLEVKAATFPIALVQLSGHHENSHLESDGSRTIEQDIQEKLSRSEESILLAVPSNTRGTWTAVIPSELVFEQLAFFLQLPPDLALKCSSETESWIDHGKAVDFPSLSNTVLLSPTYQSRHVKVRCRGLASVVGRVESRGEILERDLYDVFYRYSGSKLLHRLSPEKKRWRRRSHREKPTPAQDTNTFTLHRLRADVGIKIWAVPSLAQAHKSTKGWMAPVAFSAEVDALSEGTTDENVVIYARKIPRLEVRLAPDDELKDLEWRVFANYVKTDKTSKGSGGVKIQFQPGAVGYRRAKGASTTYFESVFSNELGDRVAKLKRAHASQLVGGALPFDLCQEAFGTFVTEQEIRLVFVGSGFDPTVLFHRYRVDFQSDIDPVVTIEPQRYSKSFNLQVENALTGAPIQGSTVSLVDSGGYSSGWKKDLTTDESGRCSTTGPASSIQVTARAAGFKTAVYPILAGGGLEVAPLVTLRLLPQSSSSVRVAVSNAGVPWSPESGRIWAMLISDEIDPMRIMHQTWEAVATEVDAEGKISFLKVPPGRYLLTILGDGMCPWVREMNFSSNASDEVVIDASLERLTRQDANVNLEAVASSIGGLGGSKLGFKRQFAVVQGDFGGYIRRVVNILRGEIVWKRVSDGSDLPYPFLPIQLLGVRPDADVDCQVDPRLQTWLVGPSGAIIPLILDGPSYTPDTRELATVRGSVAGQTGFKNLIARAVPISSKLGESSPYNVLSGVSSLVDESGNFSIRYLIPGSYRILLLRSDKAGDGDGVVLVLNRDSRTMVDLRKQEDQTVVLEADK